MMMGWWHIRRQGRGVFVHKHGKIYIIIILMMSLIMKLYICIRRTTASSAWHVSRIIFLLFLFLCIHKAYDIARIIIYTFFILNFSSSFNSKDCIISSTYLSSHNTHTHIKTNKNTGRKTNSWMKTTKICIIPVSCLCVSTCILSLIFIKNK